MSDFKVVIIGAGVVGLAIAEKLSEQFDNIIVIERNSSFGQESSSRNSEVIHAGMYYPKESLKARLCIKGNKSLYKYCDDNNVPYNRCGKYIIASDDDDINKLDAIYRQGIINGCDLKYAELSEFKDKEPLIKCAKALFSPESGIIDSHQLMHSLKYKSEQRGVDFAFNHEVFKINKITGAYKVLIRDKDNYDFEISSDIVINAAGLDSDIIAEKAGFDIDKLSYRLNYCQGHYFKLTPKYKNKINHLIYPVPSNNYGIGVHLTLDLNGYLKLGPDTQYLDSRDKFYSVSEEHKKSFFDAANKYINDIEMDDLSPDQSGIRAKLQKPGEKFRDFIISEKVIRI